jgi:hypothetical protein
MFLKFLKILIFTVVGVVFVDDVGGDQIPDLLSLVGIVLTALASGREPGAIVRAHLSLMARDTAVVAPTGWHCFVVP